MTAKRNVVEIYDRRTGEEFKHVGAKRARFGFSMTCKNLTTGQVETRSAETARLALYDALVAVGCPRDAATKAARVYPVW